MQIQIVKHIKGTVCVAASLLLIGVPSLVAMAAPSTSGVAQFGSVDVDKVVAGYTKKGVLNEQLQQQAQHFDSIIKIQAGSPMLTKQQQDQLGALLSKDKPTDADRAQITALQAQSTQEAEQLSALQQKQNPTDADKATLATLTKQQQDSQQILQDISSAYQEQMQALNAKMSEQLADSVKTAVAAVAEQRGLTVVFEAHAAIYSANDITQDVIKRLNK